MNEAELRAYCQLAQAIAWHVYEDAKVGDATHRNARPEFQSAPYPIYYNWSMSAFEAASLRLIQLDVLKPLTPVFFVFDCDVKDASAVAERGYKTGPSFDEILDTFVLLFGEYPRDWGVSTERDVPKDYGLIPIEHDPSFEVDPRIKPALDALESLGYATRTPKGFVWTDRIAPAMQRAYIWLPVQAAD